MGLNSKVNRITAERERDMFSLLFCDDERENEEVAGEKKTQKIEYPKTIELYIVNVIISCLFHKVEGTDPGGNVELVLNDVCHFAPPSSSL